MQVFAAVGLVHVNEGILETIHTNIMIDSSIYHGSVLVMKKTRNVRCLCDNWAQWHKWCSDASFITSINYHVLYSYRLHPSFYISDFKVIIITDDAALLPVYVRVSNVADQLCCCPRWRMISCLSIINMRASVSSHSHTYGRCIWLLNYVLCYHNSSGSRRISYHLPRRYNVCALLTSVSTSPPSREQETF